MGLQARAAGAPSNRKKRGDVKVTHDIYDEIVLEAEEGAWLM
jgi:hypothetical protein